MSSSHQALGRAIESQKAEFARLTVNDLWERNPQFQTRYGDTGHAKCEQDVTYTIAYLAQAVSSDSPSLFADYIEWVKVLFKGLSIPTRDLAESLQLVNGFIQGHIPESAGIVADYIEMGLARLSAATEVFPSFIDESNPLSGLARAYLAALRGGQRSTASRLITDAVSNDVEIRDIYLHVFQATQREIGRLWQINEMTVAEEHFCTAATQLIMSQLYSHIFSTKRNGRRMVATCVGGELHEIGLRMVADLFEMEGWDTYYLGASMPVSGVVEALMERKAELLAISATMTYNVHLVSEIVERVRAADMGRPIKILAGGYPFNVDRELWRKVGADGYASDAAEAIAIASGIGEAAYDRP